jgi:class 3 adenylate cyclase
LYRRVVSPFSEDDIALVETFAEQAVIAIENVRQFKALEARTEEVKALNAGLETRVAEQVAEIERMGRLKRFLSPAVADAVVSAGEDRLLRSHRALIATLFADIRGFTAFCESAEPEETIDVLRTYHGAMGEFLREHGAGVDQRVGDGIMAIFNDPLPCEHPAGNAVRMALAMRARMVELCASWKRLGHQLGFGVGISLGYATVGMVGSQDRYEYTASGTAVNVAARLCDQARDGEILLSPRAFAAVEGEFEIVPRGELTLKGIQAPVEVHQVISSRSD